MLPTFFAILTLAVLYWWPIRTWMSRWGTTASDLTRVMRGMNLGERQPAGFIMTRKMLLGLKQRAEALRAASGGVSVANERPAA